MKPSMIAGAALVLTVAAFGCNKDESKTSETNLTSATQPAQAAAVEPQEKAIEVAGAPVQFEADQVVVTQQDKDKAAKVEAAAKAKQVPSPTPKPQPLHPGDPGFTGGVAPGHIQWPPGNETGTGNPNSDGSHNIGER